MKSYITYTEKNGIYYPDLKLPKQRNLPLGKYAIMRLDFLKKHRRGTYTHLVTTATITEHLYEVEQQAKAQIKIVTEHLATSRGINDPLKQKDQLRWVQEMNNIKQMAEEMVIKDIIFA